VADYTCYVPDPFSVVDAFTKFKKDFDNKTICKDSILERSKNFNMQNYSKKMNEIYKEVIK
jgi:hypothetical protein